MNRRNHREGRKPEKKKRFRRPVSKRSFAPRTAKEYFAKSAQFQDKWNRITHSISDMRAKGLSLQQAARENGIASRTLASLARPALRKAANGRYKAKASDRLLRVMVAITQQGTREVVTRDSRQASLIAEHSNAVQKYLQTGDEKALRKLRRKTITDVSGKRIRLLTDPAELDRLGSAGVLSFESLYAKAG
jgi:hypothetical protein